MHDSIEFGRLLRGLRLKSQITQEELAERAGLSARAISALERGNVAKPQMNTVRLLARALGLSSGVAADFLEVARGRPKRIDLELCVKPDNDNELALHTFREPDLAVGAAMVPLVSSNLPHDVQGFVGREAEIAQLKSCLELANNDRSSYCPVSVVISGMPGCGKTALAVRFAHEVAERFPDGHLFIDLGGRCPDEAMSWRAAMRALLSILGHADPERLPDERAMVDTYRRLTAGRRMALVLDNAAYEGQVRPLLPASPSCLVIITSRKRLASLVVEDGAKAVVLGQLPRESAVSLLIHATGRSDELPEAHTLVEICGALPMALRVVACKAVMEPQTSLQALTRELRQQAALLNLPAAYTASPARLRDFLSGSYEDLPVEIARAFRVLGLLPTTEFSSAAVGSLLNVGRDTTNALLERMADLYLVERAGRAGRFRVNALWQTYARILAQEEDAPHTRTLAVRRLLHYYLGAAEDATTTFRPSWSEVPSSPGTGCCGGVDQARASIKWLEEEQENLAKAIFVALEGGEYNVAWRLAFLVGSFLSLRERWAEWIQLLRAGLSAARAASDCRANVAVLTALAFAYMKIRRFPKAADCFEEALANAPDELGDCRFLLRLGLLASSPCRAEARDTQGLDDPSTSPHSWPGDALILLVVGYLYRQRHHFTEAESHVRAAISVFGEAGCLADEAVGLMELGRVLQASGRQSESICYFERALHTWKDLGEGVAQGECLLAIGNSWYAIGVADEAGAAWTLALSLLEHCKEDIAAIARARLRQLRANDPDSLGDSFYNADYSTI